MAHNSDMLPEAAAPDDDPLKRDAPDHPIDDPAIVSWFLADGHRANPVTDLRMFTVGRAELLRRPVPGTPCTPRSWRSMTSGR
jgi:hypothetical protein